MKKKRITQTCSQYNLLCEKILEAVTIFFYEENNIKKCGAHQKTCSKLF